MWESISQVQLSGTGLKLTGKTVTTRRGGAPQVERQKEQEKIGDLANEAVTISVQEIMKILAPWRVRYSLGSCTFRSGRLC